MASWNGLSSTHEGSWQVYVPMCKCACRLPYVAFHVVRFVKTPTGGGSCCASCGRWLVEPPKRTDAPHPALPLEPLDVAA